MMRKIKMTHPCVRLGRQNQGKQPIHEIRNRRWRHKNMEATDVTYNSTFSDPPNDDLSPLITLKNLLIIVSLKT